MSKFHEFVYDASDILGRHWKEVFLSGSYSSGKKEVFLDDFNQFKRDSVVEYQMYFTQGHEEVVFFVPHYGIAVKASGWYSSYNETEWEEWEFEEVVEMDIIVTQYVNVDKAPEEKEKLLNFIKSFKSQ